VVLDPPAATVLAAKPASPDPASGEELSSPEAPGGTPEPPSASLSLASDLTIDEAIEKLAPSLLQSLETDFRARFTGVFQHQAPKQPTKIHPPAEDGSLEEPEDEADDD